MHADLHWKAFISSWNLSIWLFPVDGPAESHRTAQQPPRRTRALTFSTTLPKVELIVKVLIRPVLRTRSLFALSSAPHGRLRTGSQCEIMNTHKKESRSPGLHTFHDRSSLHGTKEESETTDTKHTPKNGGKRSTVIQKMSQILALIDVKTTLAVTHRPPHAAAAAHAHAPQSRDALRHHKTHFLPPFHNFKHGLAFFLLPCFGSPFPISDVVAAGF